MNPMEEGLKFDVKIDAAQLRKDAENIISNFNQIGTTAQKTGKTIDDSIASISPRLAEIGAGIAGAFAINKIADFSKQVIQLRGEIQALETSFSVLTGSADKGMALFTEIRKFAASTPMMMKDIAHGAQTMLSFNIEAEKVMPLLKAIGDISMGDAGKFQSLTLAFSQMSATGKLMGQDLLQMINAGFNPLAVIAEQTGRKIADLKKDMESGAISTEMVTKAFLDATAEGGKFNGMLAKQAEGINGAIAQLGGAVDDMMNALGNANEGIIVDSIHGIERLVKNYERVGRILLTLIATYGTYRAAVMAVTAAKGWATLAEAAHYKWLVLVEKAQKLLNATMLNNPYVLVATLIAGVVAAMVSMKSESERLKEAEEEYEAQKQKTIEAEQKHQQELEKLCSIAGNESLATDTRREALQQLEKKYPSIFVKYDTEYEKLKNIAAIKKEIAELDGKTSISNPTNELNNINGRITELEAEKARLDKINQQLRQTPNYNPTWEQRLTPDQQAELENLYKKRAEAQTKVREQEIDNYLGKLDNVSDSILNAEIKARQDVLARMELSGNSRGRIIGGGASGNFTKDQLEYQLNRLKAEQNKRNAPKETASKWANEAKNEYEEALKAYNSFIQQKGAEMTKEEFEQKSEELKGILDKAKKNYDKYKIQKAEGSSNGKTSLELNAEVEAAQLKADETRKKVNFSTLQALTQQELEHQQQLIELMEEGEAKRIAQRELNARIQIEQQKDTMRQMLQTIIDGEKAEFDAEEELKAKREAARGNKHYAKRNFSIGDLDISNLDTDSNIVEGGDLSEEAKNRMNEIINFYREYIQNIQIILDKELNEKEQTALNEYLREFGSYIEKRNAIIALADQQIAQAETEGARKSIQANMEKELSDLDIIANRKISAITLLFDDFSEKSIADLKKLAEQGKRTLDFLKTGLWNEETGAQLGITKETFNVLSRTPEEIEKIEKALKSLNREIDNSKIGFSLIEKGLKEIFKDGNNTKKFQDAISKISTGLGQINNAATFLSESLATLGDALGSNALSSIAEGLSVATDALDTAMQGAQAGAVFGPIGAAAGAALGVVTSLVSAFSKLHDAKYEKRIERLQDQIDALDESYNRLGRAIDKAYSVDAANLMKQQQSMLRQQQILIQQMIKEEESKKNSDSNRIKEWKNQINEINNQLKDLEEQAADAIYGEDIKSAIENFASAYEGMFDSGITKAKASKDIIKSMIKQMILEALKMDISAPMEKLRQMMMNFWADGYISQWEQEQLNAYAEGIMGDLQKKYGWADSYFNQATNQSSSKGGFTTMSQDSADELNGRFTALQMSNEIIKNTTLEIGDQLKVTHNRLNIIGGAVEEIRGMSLIAIDYLETITKHTSNLPAIKDGIERIDKHTQRL